MTLVRPVVQFNRGGPGTLKTLNQGGANSFRVWAAMRSGLRTAQHQYISR